MFDLVSASEAAKWAVLVFAAGFIGFFGKSLARAMASLFRKKKSELPSADQQSGNILSQRNDSPSGALQDRGRIEESGPLKDDQKIIKKAWKAQQKALKKNGK